jgi:type I restriction enzyme S subunit
MRKKDRVPSGWKSLKLEELLTQGVKNGYSPNCPEEPNGSWILSLANLTENGLDPTQAKPAPLDDDKTKDFLLRPGDFLISRSNTLDKVGRVALFRGEIENCSYPDLLMRFRANEAQVTNEYLENFLKSPMVRKHIQSCASGTSGSMVKISKSVVEKIPVIFPSIPEQKAIADLLSTWDEAITKTERLIQAKERQLKQMSRWLLFGHKRLGNPKNELIDARFFQYPSDWTLVKIGKVAKEVSTHNSEDEQTVLSCSKYDGFVNSLDYFGKQVFSNDTSNYKVVEKGQFAYPSNHIEEGSIGLLKHCEKGIVSPIYVVFEASKEKVHSPYLYKLLKTDIYQHIFQVSTSSSVDRRGSLRWGEFSKIKVLVPSLAEQQEISGTLSSFQHEIDLLKRLADKYKTQKRGLMQKLLTGTWRIKPEIINQYQEV